MSKQAKTTPATTFTAGDRVTVTLPDTFPLVGTIETVTQQGWFVVLLDPEFQQVMTEAGDKRMKEGKISCRARSLNPPPRDDDGNVTAPEQSAPADPDAAEEAPEGEEEKAEHPMAKALREARVRYVKTKRPEGTSSMDCGDLLARTLRDLEPLEVAALADKVLGEAAGYHASKYGHLNPGQIRMNSGNRIRAFLKTADAEGLEHAHKVLGWDEEAEGEEGDEE